jgi:hypothetical protein
MESSMLLKSAALVYGAMVEVHGLPALIPLGTGEKLMVPIWRESNDY